MNIKKIFLAIILLFTYGCAFFVDGRQEVVLSAHPENTKIILDNVDVGKGKAIVKLDPRESHLIKYINKGYEDYSSVIQPESTGFRFTNRGTAFFCVIDAFIGGFTLFTNPLIAVFPII